jgi:hypothetical protein
MTSRSETASVIGVLTASAGGFGTDRFGNRLLASVDLFA